MKKSEKILLILVVLALLYGGVDFVLRGHKRAVTGQTASQAEGQVSADIAAQLGALSTPEGQKIDHLAASLNDPWPAAGVFAGRRVDYGGEAKAQEAKAEEVKTMREKAGKLVYTGFLSMGNERIAIINGMDYRVGEQVDEFTVSQINKDSLQVTEQGNSFAVPAAIAPESAKVPGRLEIKTRSY